MKNEENTENCKGMINEIYSQKKGKGKRLCPKSKKKVTIINLY